MLNSQIISPPQRMITKMTNRISIVGPETNMSKYQSTTQTGIPTGVRVWALCDQ